MTAKLKPIALGLAMGVLWGIYALIMGLIAVLYASGKPLVAGIGFDPTILGSIFGGVIGFINAFIGGFIIAWLYNLFSCAHYKKGESCKKPELTTKSEHIESDNIQ